MKWKNILTEKRNENLILISIILMIVMIGYMHNRHISDMKAAVTSIYEDRLVAKNYILTLTQKIHEKKAYIGSKDEFFEKSIAANHAMMQVIEEFEETKLTDDESHSLRKLKKNISFLEELEIQVQHNPSLLTRDALKDRLEDQHNLILNDLVRLSEIQLVEGKKLLEDSNQIMTSNSVTNRVETALIIIVFLIFIMINSSSKRVVKKDLWYA
ncbi:MCP four helix bundle domain-containing protein [Ekhidna sp.]|uniref:MCP four helix bundle domain-containing protein n=1 Tax=Ekhidna sp. TaxID=2608089 RepID=UPI0032982960